jgi:hypothetical protein
METFDLFGFCISIWTYKLSRKNQEYHYFLIALLNIKMSRIMPWTVAIFLVLVVICPPHSHLVKLKRCKRSPFFSPAMHYFLDRCADINMLLTS